MRVAIPKGRLEEPSWNWLGARGFLRGGGSAPGRRLWNRLEGLDVVTMRGRDIPRLLQEGVVDVSVLGRDLVEEAGFALGRAGNLGFGRCRLVLAVPSASTWGPGPETRIATRYPRITRRWLAAHALPGEVVTLAGAVEAAPWLGLADAVVDIVETGATLRDNGLRAVETLMESYATLVWRADAAETGWRLLGAGGDRAAGGA